jgi:hypothetical protein
MRVRQAFVGVLLWAALTSPAFCDEKPEALPGYCLEQQTATVNVQFTLRGTDVLAIKQKFDTNIKELQSLSTEIGVTRMNATGKNYTIQSLRAAEPYDGPAVCLDCLSRTAPQVVDDSTPYQLFGNVNFTIDPPSKASELLGLLRRNGHTATLSLLDVNQAAGKCGLNVTSKEWKPGPAFFPSPANPYVRNIANVTMPFSGPVANLQDARALIATGMKALLPDAAGAGVVNIRLQSASYSVTASGEGFEVNGNMFIDVMPEEKTGDFTALLAKKGVTATINYFRACR